MRVNQRKIKQSSEMLSTELKFLGHCLRNYYLKNIEKPKTLMEEKIAFEKSNPIYWENRKCVICTFPFDTDIQARSDEMPYIGFTIRKEYIF